ncbi:hypothetical protein C0995_006377 [Termitomyces sp. Mi166|nr:hypothetical protein C0995_006377 [Termitomyces sp. Mi166\
MSTPVLVFNPKNGTYIARINGDKESTPAGQKELPMMLLYDERGLRLCDDIITKTPEYHFYGVEEEILKSKADEIRPYLCLSFRGPGEGRRLAYSHENTPTLDTRPLEALEVIHGY